MLPPERVRLLPERKPVKLDDHWHSRATTRGIFSDMFGSVTDLVTRPVRTVGALLRRPGQVVRDYLQGNREEVAGPGRMAFLGVSLFLIVNSLLASDISRMLDPFIWFRDYMPYFAPLLLLPISALQKRLFRREGMTFGDTYAFGLYMLGQVAVFRTVLLTINHFTGIGDVYSSTADLLLNGAIMAVEAAYVAWSATGFYRNRRFTTWLRGALTYGSFVALGYGVLYAIVSFIWRGVLS